jgi:hypothetical protein
MEIKIFHNHKLNEFKDFKNKAIDIFSNLQAANN